MLSAAVRTTVLVVGAVAGVCAHGAGQADGDDLVGRLGAYVDAWEPDLGSVVADEIYEQTVVRTPRSGSVRRQAGPSRESRQLVSEFTLIRFDDGVPDWIGFRSVRSVDGRPVSDPGPSLNQLLNDASLTWSARWARVQDMSAAFNIGSIARDVNLPTFGLHALRRVNRTRFSFSRPRTARVGSDALAVVDFRERARPTLVSGLRGRDVPLVGTVWFDARDGRVHRTEIQLRDLVPASAEAARDHSEPDQDLSSRITVVFGPDANVGAWVPIEMRERYDNSWGEVTTGHATYANHRRFRTSGRIVRPK